MDGPEKLLPNFRAGDPWGASAANQIIRKLLSLLTLRCTAPLQGKIEGTNVQLWIQKSQQRKVCVVTTAISARSSSTSLTPGQGAVELYTLNPSTGDMVDSGIAINPIYCFTSTIGGVPINTWGFVVYDDDGNPWFISNDCGN
jgi:hypothetical protein